jgi:uncharacterized membrane protein YgdD (TMEM256/DUF423 family)
MTKFALVSGCLLMGAAVALGAFGAHGLREYFIGREEEIWKTAVFYQSLHALSLLFLGLAYSKEFLGNLAYRSSLMLILVGTLVFSGSLYCLVLSRIKWLGAITPIGGSMLILAWILLSLSFYSRSCKTPFS